jgi:hypothetical protein
MVLLSQENEAQVYRAEHDYWNKDNWNKKEAVSQKVPEKFLSPSL